MRFIHAALGHVLMIKRSSQPAIGILGGTFDPIHLGHLHLANSIYQQLHLQKIIFIPTSQPLLRHPAIATASQRLEMLRIAIKEYPYFEVDDCELNRSAPSYSIDTLRELRKKIPDQPLCFIMAADQLIQFDQWHEWQKIPDLAHLIITDRPGYELRLNDATKQLLNDRQITDPTLLSEKNTGYIYLVNIEAMPISATKIRSELAKGKEPISFLPKGVWKYIKENGLYKS
jgi:nicotinate-nucleotide adenylyltransferase